MTIAQKVRKHRYPELYPNPILMFPQIKVKPLTTPATEELLAELRKSSNVGRILWTAAKDEPPTITPIRMATQNPESQYPD